MQSALEKLTQVEGCSSETAEGILSKLNKGEELTDREHDFVCEAEVFGYGETERRRANAEQRRKERDSTPVSKLAEQETIQELGYRRPDVSHWVGGALLFSSGFYYLLIEESSTARGTYLFTAVVTAIVWFWQRRRKKEWDALYSENYERIARVRENSAENDAPSE